MMGGKGFWRRTGERYQPPAMIEHDRYGGGGVMVWGWITMAGRTELHICQGCVTGLDYRDNGGGLFLACEDFGGRSVIPGLQGFFFFLVEISSHSPIPLFLAKISPQWLSELR